MGCRYFPKLEDLDSFSLNFWLNKFVQEVGDRYAPRSLYGIVCGLKRHLKDKNGGKALNPLDRSYKRYFSRSCALVQSALHDIKSL